MVPTPLCGAAVAVALRGRECAARWCSRFVQSRQLRTLRKHVFNMETCVRGRGSRFVQTCERLVRLGHDDHRNKSSSKLLQGTLYFRLPMISGSVGSTPVDVATSNVRVLVWSSSHQRVCSRRGRRSLCIKLHQSKPIFSRPNSDRLPSPLSALRSMVTAARKRRGSREVPLGHTKLTLSPQHVQHTGCWNR